MSDIAWAAHMTSSIPGMHCVLVYGKAWQQMDSSVVLDRSRTTTLRAHSKGMTSSKPCATPMKRDLKIWVVVNDSLQEHQ